MAQLTITSKGQVTLKKEILAHLGVEPGQKVDIEVLPGGRIAVRAVPQSTINDFIGCLSATGESLSLDDMEEAIAEGWSRG